MNINKVYWHSSDGKVSLTMPFAKVDAESRTVSGFASLDNVDSHNDVVTTDASIEAFNRFRGNLREMHQPVAVGKVKSFAPETLYDPETNKYYSGVYVNAYVSKGAGDTWEKVLDGTLSGFSIGGVVVDSENVWDDSLKKHVQVIKKMDLYELSLVDNPANPLANVVSIQKVDSAEDHVDSFTENVFTCTTCKSIVSSPVKEKSCPSCDAQMHYIGWLERDAAVKKEIKKMVDDFYASDDKSVESPLPETDENTSEGEVNMSDIDNVEEPVAEESEVVETEATTEEVVDDVVEEVTDEVVEESEDDSDVDDSVDGEAVAGAEQKASGDFETITAELADLRTILEQIVANSKSIEDATAEATAEVSKAFDAKLEEFKASITESLDTIQKSVTGVEKSVDGLANKTAVKKSGDLGGEPDQNIKKSLWDGHFLGIDSLDRE